ncbi:EF-P beta-lysylation protein EpmB [Nitrincola sp.]|uniref:EF-P beta-lysylation protein EpmB n=1 Tax=Nitrincola sp. TaxID=1926584 RepID=UPI003A903DCC
MIQIPFTQLRSWQDELRDAITDPAELLSHLELSTDLLEAAIQADALFGLKVPRPYLARIEKGNPLDPLLLQVLPQHQETQPQPGYSEDPLAEQQANPLPGLIHKYTHRVLLVLSGACAINCRYCFRRHFAYQENQLGKQQWLQILNYLRQHPEVDEVIFSGGDPLATPDTRLQRMIQDLEQIPHLERLRIHTRLPVVIPSRITPTLLSALSSTRLQSLIVLHINHPNEIDDGVRQASRLITQQNIPLLNQSVLLKGINDSVSVQKTLSKTLFAAGILPYYLFLFDPVVGAAHFDLPEVQAKDLAAKLQAELPGYLMPRLAVEIPGKASKTLLIPTYDTRNHPE